MYQSYDTGQAKFWYIARTENIMVIPKKAYCCVKATSDRPGSRPVSIWLRDQLWYWLSQRWASIKVGREVRLIQVDLSWTLLRFLNTWPQAAGEPSVKLRLSYEKYCIELWFFVGSTVTSDQAVLQIFGLGNVFKTARACINLICIFPMSQVHEAWQQAFFGWT